MILGSHTLRNESRDFVEWHRGRSPYVLWALDLDRPMVRRRVAAARRHLGGLLVGGYRRQAHVTLDLCGFPGVEPLAPDEFSPLALAAACSGWERALPPAFEITIGGLDSFCSAPFLRVADPAGGIAALRRVLAGAGHNRSRSDYVPHVTVGLYAEAWPAAAVDLRLRAFLPGRPLRCTIDCLTLMAYQPQQIGGELLHLGEYCLRQRTMRWPLAV